MKKNESMVDRIIRIIIGIILIYLGWVTLSNNLWGIILDIIGIILIITGLTGYCHLYKLLGMKTCEKCGGGAPMSETAQEPNMPQPQNEMNANEEKTPEESSSEEGQTQQQ